MNMNDVDDVLAKMDMEIDEELNQDEEAAEPSEDI